MNTLGVLSGYSSGVFLFMSIPLMAVAFTKRDKTTCDSDIFLFKPDKRFKIWFYIVGEVQRQDYKKWERGSNWFTYETISGATGATKQQIYKCLDWMRKNGMIETSKETRGMMIKVLNYAKFQDIKKQGGDTEEIERRHGGDTEEILHKKKIRIKNKEDNNNFVIEKTEEKPKIPKPKREGPTRKEKEAVIEDIKKKVEAYGMVYNPEQDKDFAGHILSKKMTEIAAKYGYMTPLAFLLSVVDMSMQETGGRLDKRWRFKVNGPKVLYQKYAEICADYQNSTSAANSGDIQQF